MVLNSFITTTVWLYMKIYSSIYMIQRYTPQQPSIYLIMYKERWYSMYPQEKRIWDKISESSKATILGNDKISQKCSTHVNFHDVTHGDIIKTNYYQFRFDDTTNYPSNVDPTRNNHSINGIRDDSTILINLYKRESYLLQIYGRHYLVQIHLLNRK